MSDKNASTEKNQNDKNSKKKNNEDFNLVRKKKQIYDTPNRSNVGLDGQEKQQWNQN